MAQHDINDMNLQMASARIPPSWCPENERRYSFRRWRQDVALWAAATDMDVARQGAAVALRLTGEAKKLAHAIGAAELVAGRVMADENGVVAPRTGLEMLIIMLSRQYAALTQEEQLHSISTIMGFRRKGLESTDECVARFELARHQAETHIE